MFVVESRGVMSFWDCDLRKRKSVTSKSFRDPRTGGDWRRNGSL